MAGVCSLRNNVCPTLADVTMNATQAGMTLTPRVLFTLLALVRLLRLIHVDDLTLLALFTCWISPTARRRVCQHGDKLLSWMQRTGLIAACASVFRAAVVTLVISVQYALWQCGVPRRWLPDISEQGPAAADDIETAAPPSNSQDSSKTCSHGAAVEAAAAAE
jgi:hypothetical protein